MLDTFLRIIGVPLGAIIKFCYNIIPNYGIAIILFTMIAKIILLPISCWVQRNSITMVKIMPEINRIKAEYFGDQDAIGEETQKLYKKEHYHPILSVVPLLIQFFLLMGVIGAVKDLLGSSDSILNLIPVEKGGSTLFMPLLAGLSAVILTWNQNKMNPLQKEQTKAEKVFTGATSIGISLVLGFFVSLGTGIYWIASNLFSACQQPLLNVLVNPKKYIDYEALNRSRAELEEMSSLGGGISKEDKKREKEDYKRFFSIANKHLVFYSEKSGFYKYYQNCIEYLLTHTKGSIHYITNDPDDQIFEIAKTHPMLKPYYIGPKKLITLMMKMDANLVVMTTPGLNTSYLKKSYISKDIEYIYMFHHMTSTTMVDLKGAYDNYDTILTVGPHQDVELRAAEEMYGIRKRNIVPCGYGMLDNMLESYEKMDKKPSDKKRILIAPSWGEDNILDSCIEPLVDSLYAEDTLLVVRPHPEYVKRFPQKMAELKEKFKDRNPGNFQIESDFSSNVSIYSADLVVTDWSSIAFEYSYTTKKPSLFINTKMKILNPDYVKYPEEPLDILLRDQIGKSISKEETANAKETVEWMFRHADEYREKITGLVNRYVYNVGNSGEAAAKYILSKLTQSR